MFLKNIKLIDHVFIAEGDSGVNSINIIKPNFYFKGNDYKKNSSDKTKKIFEEIKAVKKNNGKVVYTNEKHMSSSKIANESGLVLNDMQAKFVNQVKKKINFNQLVKILHKISLHNKKQ